MHVFISRAGKDHECAEWIARVLREAGHTTTLQDEDFRPGHSFLHQMKLALDRADHVICLLSPAYLEREFTLKELYAAIADDGLGEKRLFIPVLVTPCEIPRLIKDIVYVNFVGKDDAERKRALLGAFRGARTTERPAIRTSIQKLPSVDPYLIGRDAQLNWLERAWSDPKANFVQMIAPGGTGKTALMTKWYRRHLYDATIFGWSFYSQGTHEKSQTSSDPFFAEVLPWFGITVQPTESVWAKVDRLVERLRQERVLLILDGIEPLQNSDGSLRDLALKALLEELAARNAGMVLCTTRVRLSDVPDDDPPALSLDLDNLDPADGAAYLSHLKVLGPVDELREASEAYGNHALALTLLGTYLVTFGDGDIRRRTDIRELQVDETKPGRHARKVMASYARMYEGQPELDILRALGYFDRPAEREALKLVLPKMEERQYRAALKALRDARLILTADPTQPLDCHPLVREYFAADATQEGHARLYEHYKARAPHRPDTFQELTPLFYAVYHGCQAGRHQEALDEVYRDRILRYGEGYLVKKLGAFGANLSLLAHFFAIPWSQPIATLSIVAQFWVISDAGFSLRAVGRLGNAVEPTRVAAEGAVAQKDWKNASIRYGNLSQLHLTLGNVPESASAARQSVEFADRHGDGSRRAAHRTALADALQQSGDFAGALQLFEEAERLQVELQPDHSILYSVQGYRYCDLLLSQGRGGDVLRRVSETLPWAEGKGLLLDIGLDHLSLGRAQPPGSSEAAHHLDQAVEFLRRAGTLHMLPLALLARGTPRDLDEVFRIATRSGMRLHLTDYHLASARLALSRNDRDKAREHFEKAATLIRDTGYRRDAELEALRTLLS
jgi:tetratricopeptide (TPR) repeat protein